MDIHNNRIGLNAYLAGAPIPNISTRGLMYIEGGSNIYVEPNGR
jgi:hypothetical protein